MRCVFRGILIGFLVFVTIIYFVIRALHNAADPDYEEVVDEAARRILEGETDISNVTERPGVSVSVAIVLIVCLISVFLLITGIIIVAITLDPTTAEDDDSEIESDDSKPYMDPPSFYSHSEFDHLFAEISNDDDDEGDQHFFTHPDL
ncbi:unnamed protein product [Auanema sp. JU1783]|nr:unnamed protein product [Auanema sp. JU1783]